MRIIIENYSILIIIITYSNIQYIYFLCHLQTRIEEWSLNTG